MKNWILRQKSNPLSRHPYLREYGSVDFEKISSVVEEAATSVYSSKPYIDLELNDGGYKTKQQ